MDNKKLVKWAIVNSLGVFAYSSLVVLIMLNGENIFGKANNFGSMIILLMIFVLSAAVVGSLVLGRPIFLYLDGNKKESIKLLLYTILSLFFITLITAIIYVLIK